MFKSLVDGNNDQCGRPNPLITLSRALGQANSRVGSAIGWPGQQGQVATSESDLLANEYLEGRRAQQPPPSTFDMRQLLEQLPRHRSQLERGWAETREMARTTETASGWASQFLQEQQSFPSQQWVDHFNAGQQNGEMHNAWQDVKEKSVWARDFLKQFDMSDSGGKVETATADELARVWEKEFMDHLAGRAPTFFDYESAWEAAHSKEAQEHYDFSQANPYLGEEQPMERAQESFGQGRVAEAILHYEAALRADPQNPEIWFKLGLAQAENEQDPAAISALRNALKLNAHHKGAILGLAVSLANESFDQLALRELQKWILVHRGGELPPSNMATVGQQDTAQYRQYLPLDSGDLGEVERQFLAAVHGSQQTDPELLNALGVLYNLGRDYDRAVDCLRAALALRPDDPIIWNRLGATLANADRSAEAIGAYKRALQLFPSYVRARYNLGIACMNLTSHREAASHLLTALKIQHSADQSQIWSRLRSALIRIDLSPADSAEMYNALERRDLAGIARFVEPEAID